MKKNKTDIFCDLIKNDIKSGILKPGEKISSLNDFVNDHEFSKGTIRHAVTQLKQDGFINIKDRSGMYVAASPPCLSRYALVMLNSRRSCENSIFLGKLRQQFLRLEDDFQGKINFVSYCCNINDPQCADRMNFEYDLKKQRLAGVIWVANMPDDDIEEILNIQITVPSVAIFKESGKSVCLNLSDFWKKSLEFLNQGGCERIAALCQSNSKKDPEIVETFSRFSPSYWMLPLHHDDVWAAKDLLHLLFHYPRESRPDGLIIGDDHYLDGALSMFLEAGIIPSKDVKIVLYTNFPNESTLLFPLEMFGYDVRELLYCAFDILKDSEVKHSEIDAICGRDVLDESIWKKRFTDLFCP